MMMFKRPNTTAMARESKRRLDSILTDEAIEIQINIAFHIADIEENQSTRSESLSKLEELFKLLDNNNEHYVYLYEQHRERLRKIIIQLSEPDKQTFFANLCNQNQDFFDKFKKYYFSRSLYEYITKMQVAIKNQSSAELFINLDNLFKILGDSNENYAYLYNKYREILRNIITQLSEPDKQLFLTKLCNKNQEFFQKLRRFCIIQTFIEYGKKENYIKAVINNPESDALVQVVIDMFKTDAKGNNSKQEKVRKAYIVRYHLATYCLSKIEIEATLLNELSRIHHNCPKRNKIGRALFLLINYFNQKITESLNCNWQTLSMILYGNDNNQLYVQIYNRKILNNFISELTMIANRSAPEPEKFLLAVIDRLTTIVNPQDVSVNEFQRQSEIYKLNLNNFKLNIASKLTRDAKKRPTLEQSSDVVNIKTPTLPRGW